MAPKNKKGRIQKFMEKKIKLALWEILVPSFYPNGAKIEVAYHRIWDNKVRKIAGGLTIFQPTRGQWLSLDKHLFAEKMIPVRVGCTKSQIQKIADFTADHYKQKAVMYYLVSDKIFIKHY